MTKFDIHLAVVAPQLPPWCVPTFESIEPSAIARCETNPTERSDLNILEDFINIEAPRAPTCAFGQNEPDPQ